MNEHQAGTNTLTLLEAAHEIMSDTLSEHDAEVALALAIQRGELHANIMRWATEQWDGRQLPGNINRLETRIERADFEAWRQRKSAAG